jgi:hypothetical protein
LKPGYKHRYNFTFGPCFKSYSADVLTVSGRDYSLACRAGLYQAVLCYAAGTHGQLGYLSGKYDFNSSANSRRVAPYAKDSFASPSHIALLRACAKFDKAVIRGSHRSFSDERYGFNYHFECHLIAPFL